MSSYELFQSQTTLVMSLLVDTAKQEIQKAFTCNPGESCFHLTVKSNDAQSQLVSIWYKDFSLLVACDKLANAFYIIISCKHTFKSSLFCIMSNIVLIKACVVLFFCKLWWWLLKLWLPFLFTFRVFFRLTAYFLYQCSWMQ